MIGNNSSSCFMFHFVFDMTHSAVTHIYIWYYTENERYILSVTQSSMYTPPLLAYYPANLQSIFINTIWLLGILNNENGDKRLDCACLPASQPDSIIYYYLVYEYSYKLAIYKMVNT